MGRGAGHLCAPLAGGIAAPCALATPGPPRHPSLPYIARREAAEARRTAAGGAAPRPPITAASAQRPAPGGGGGPPAAAARRAAAPRSAALPRLSLLPCLPSPPSLSPSLLPLPFRPPPPSRLSRGGGLSGSPSYRPGAGPEGCPRLPAPSPVPAGTPTTPPQFCLQISSQQVRPGQRGLWSSPRDRLRSWCGLCEAGGGFLRPGAAGWGWGTQRTPALPAAFWVPGRLGAPGGAYRYQQAGGGGPRARGPGAALPGSPGGGAACTF